MKGEAKICPRCHQEYVDEALHKLLCPAKDATPESEPQPEQAPEPQPEQAPEPEPVIERVSETHETPAMAQGVPQVTPKASHGLRVPAVRLTYTPDWVLESICGAIRAADNGERAMVLLTGPHGDGKSHVAQQIAARRNAPFCEWSCQRMMEPSDFFVVTKARDGSTVDIPTELYHAVKTPGCVIHLQEPNRAANPKVINTIIDLTDPTADYSTTVWELDEKLQLAPGIIVVASVNEGYSYTGVDPMDMALKSRFMGLDMGLPPQDIIQDIIQGRNGGYGAFDSALAQKETHNIAELAEGLAEWPHLVRSNRVEPELGVRELVKIRKFLDWGISLETACRIAVRPICDDEQRLAVLLQYAQQSLGIRGNWENWVKW